MFAALVSGELGTAVLHLKFCVTTTESKQFAKKLQEQFSEIFGKDCGPPLQIQVSLKQIHHLVGEIHQTDVFAYPICVIDQCFITQIQAKN